MDELEVTTDKTEKERLVTLTYAMQHYLFNKTITTPFASQLEQDCWGVLEVWSRSNLRRNALDDNDNTWTATEWSHA